MVFILDRSLFLTFQNATGETHALYDYICYEYLLGRNFSNESFKNFQRGVRPMDEIERDWSTHDAMERMSRLIQRWCFPTRVFLVRILITLSQTIRLFGDLAEADIESIGNKSCYYETLWDRKDAKHAQVFADLYDVLSEEYIKKDPESGWSAFQHWHDWLNHHIKEKLSWPEAPELFDKNLVLQHFGWQANKTFNEKSTCHVLMRYIGDFVNLSHRKLATGAENGEYAQHVRDLAFQKGSRGKDEQSDSFHLVLGELWESSWSKYKRLHQINYADRIKPDKSMSNSWEGDGTCLELVNLKNQGEFTQMNSLVQGLYLSGYQAQAIYRALTRWEHFATKHRVRAQGELEGPSLARWLNQINHRPDFLSDERDGAQKFTGFDPRHGAVPDKNWRHIRDQALASLKDQSEVARMKQRVQDRVEENLVVDDSVPQPSGAQASATKEEQEDPGEDTNLPTIPLVLGGFALLFYLMD